MTNSVRDVFIDPDGTLQKTIGLLVLVIGPTGIRYSTQCNGIVTEERAAEGFLVPVGGSDSAQELTSWFRNQFPCVETWSASDWTEERVGSLNAIVRKIPIWSRIGSDDSRSFLAVDEEHVHETVEAWIPVLTPLGRGYLLFANSD